MKLKSIIAIVFAMPVIAFGQTCFEPVVPVAANLPQRVCIESVSVTANEKVLQLVTTDSSLPQNLDIFYTSRHTEDRVRFLSTGGMLDFVDSVCGYGFFTSLHISGEIVSGQIDPEALTVSVNVETTRDVCHSSPDLETFQYKLAK